MANEEKILEALHRLPDDADLALLWLFTPDGVEEDDDFDARAFLQHVRKPASFYGQQLFELKDGGLYDDAFAQMDEEYSLWGPADEVLQDYADWKEEYPREAEVWMDELESLCQGDYDKLPTLLEARHGVLCHEEMDVAGGSLNLYDDLIQPYYEKEYEEWKKDQPKQG